MLLRLRTDKTADADVATVTKSVPDDVGTDVYLTLKGVVRKLVGYPHIGRPVLGCIEADTKLKSFLQNF